MKEPARLVRRRFAEVVAYFEHPYANAVLEGADSVVRNVKCFASMFVRQVRQCFSVVWADGFPRCRHRFPVM